MIRGGPEGLGRLRPASPGRSQPTGAGYDGDVLLEPLQILQSILGPYSVPSAHHSASHPGSSASPMPTEEQNESVTRFAPLFRRLGIQAQCGLAAVYFLRTAGGEADATKRLIECPAARRASRIRSTS